MARRLVGVHPKAFRTVTSPDMGNAAWAAAGMESLTALMQRHTTETWSYRPARAGIITTVPVFDRDFTQQIAARYPDALSREGCDLAAVTLSPERAQMRNWLDHEVEQLPAPGRNKLIARLRHPAQFITGVNELATAAVLRDAGLPVEYEVDLHGRTPDLFVPADGDRRPVIVEVWTREPPREAAGQQRAWQDLQRRIAKIPVPVGLRVECVGVDAVRPPNSAESKKLATAVREWLLSTLVRLPGDSLALHGYRFHIWGPVPRLTAVLATPGRTSTVTSKLVVEAIKKKVRKYAAVAKDLDTHLVVVLAAHPQAPLDVHMVQAAVGGRQSLKVSFTPDARGTLADWNVRLRRDETPERFGPALSAVGWVNANRGDPDLTLFSIHSAAAPLPQLTSQRMYIYQ